MYLSNIHGDPLRGSNISGNVFSVSVSILITSIEHYWGAVRTNTLDSASLYNEICIFHISSYYSNWITHTTCTNDGKKRLVYRGIMLLVAWYDGVKLFCHLLDGQIEMLIPEKVIYLPGMSISTHSLRSWTTMSKFNWYFNTCSTLQVPRWLNYHHLVNNLESDSVLSY